MGTGAAPADDVVRHTWMVAPVDPAKGLMVTTRTGTRPAVDQRCAFQSLAPRFV